MSRADRVAARLAERGLDLLIVTDLVNLRYLTGFTGTNGLAVVGPDTRRFLTDFRYVERAKAEVDGLRPAARAAGAARGARRGLAGRPAARRLRGPARLRAPPRRAARHAARPARARRRGGGLVEEERAVKEPGEIAAIRAAAALVDEIYAWVRERGLVGRTERDVALALEQEMRLRGAEGPSFPSIVAAEENGALPHATPRDVAIPAGTLVTLDIGAKLDGYCSDCTRTWATGPLPDDLEALYALVLEAQETALDAVRPGPEGREVDAVARDLIEAAGHGDHFGHGLGHGVGLDIHEAPRLARTAEGAARGGERRHGRAGRLRARPRRGADRGSRRRHRGRPRRAERDVRSRSPWWGRDPIARHGPSRPRAHRPIPGAMELRARIPSPLRRAALMAALVALAAPATAGAAPTAKAAKKKVKAPVVTKVSPLDVAVGETPDHPRQATSSPAATRTRSCSSATAPARCSPRRTSARRRCSSIKVPASLQEFFALQRRRAAARRASASASWRKKFGKKFTKNKLSPIVSGPRAPAGRAPTESRPTATATATAPRTRHDADDDNDGLADDVELSLCASTPASRTPTSDGVLDKWEFDCDRDGVLNRDEADDDDDLLERHARDGDRHQPVLADTRRRRGRGRLRVPVGHRPQRRRVPAPEQRRSPYPGKRPYPNPLFADADVDYDGDSLTLKEEYDLWIYTYSVAQTATAHARPAVLLRRPAVLALPHHPERRDAGRREPTRAVVQLRQARSSSPGRSGSRLRRRRTSTRRPDVRRPLRRRSLNRPVRHRATPTSSGASVDAVRGATTSTTTTTASSPTTSATRTPTASPTTTSRTAA